MLNTFTNRLKPHRAEAIQRIRTNALCLITTLLLSYLLPVPSLLTALKTLRSSSHHTPWSAEWIWDWICLLETALVTLLFYNILEASYAIKYPRALPPPFKSPSKPKANLSSTPQRSFKILSPNTSPQVQRPFAFSPKASTSRVLPPFPSSTPGPNNSLSYVPSPLDTPSGVISYGSVPPSSTNTQKSSVSDYLQTPSPIISAYKGKHNALDVGRALDGSYLSQIMPEVEDEED